MGVPKYCSGEREKKKKKDNICGQTTKDTAKEKASTSHIGKGTGILWGGEHASRRCTSA